MMDINDVKKLIDNVAHRPFFCSDTEITQMQIMSSERKKGYISQMDRNCNSC